MQGPNYKSASCLVGKSQSSIALYLTENSMHVPFLLFNRSENLLPHTVSMMNVSFMQVRGEQPGDARG